MNDQAKDHRTDHRPRRRGRWLLVLVLLAGLAAAAWTAAPTVSPRFARRAALRALKAGRYQPGIARFAAYARRWPAHAAGHDPVSIGAPERLRLEPLALGVLLTGPALPPPATAFPDRETAGPAPADPTTIDEGPLWLDETRLAYATGRPGEAPVVAILETMTRALEVQPPAAARHYTMTFEAAAKLLGREDLSAVLALEPPLGGATSARLLAVAPDGTWLIFRGTAAGEPPYELWRCRPDGADAQRLAVATHPCGAVRFAPDGSRLAWFDPPAVCVASLADKQATVLRSYDLTAVLQPAAPAWSPDGAELAYGVGSGDAWSLVTCPLANPQAEQERPRLNPLLSLQYAGSKRLLQTQQELDRERWLVTLRTESDPFHSRILVDGGRHAALSPDGTRLAWRAAHRLAVLLMPEPLGDLSAERLPADKLPERPGGPPAPASPEPDDAAPPKPSIET